MDASFVQRQHPTKPAHIISLTNTTTTTRTRTRTMYTRTGAARDVMGRQCASACGCTSIQSGQHSDLNGQFNPINHTRTRRKDATHRHMCSRRVLQMLAGLQQAPRKHTHIATVCAKMCRSPRRSMKKANSVVSKYQPKKEPQQSADSVAVDGMVNSNPGAHRTAARAAHRTHSMDMLMRSMVCR